MPDEIPPPRPAPPLRLPEWALPPYRYVPGLHPHPLQHPDGHRCGPPDPTPGDPDRLWLRGHDLFDQGFLWEAHEAWEQLWHTLPRGSAYRSLVQACIQTAAAHLKRHLGHDQAAHTLADRARRHLSLAEAEAGPVVAGLALADWRRRL